MSKRQSVSQRVSEVGYLKGLIEAFEDDGDGASAASVQAKVDELVHGLMLEGVDVETGRSVSMADDWDAPRTWKS